MVRCNARRLANGGHVGVGGVVMFGDEGAPHARRMSINRSYTV